ncbi:5-dehydro-4-deoxy-D-glucuronate isomerase [Antiquaquibacter soli]|uniref:4-deoxy-L-threo-5-hexosulose-uronate ketol-isomerase n=1 Tax=Antiquaquibacter soli TaxID=3064523 RepID=A0ABT9BQF5_9MICO|nr:5-dehydro-4-deoxy-D-glucuronate isomerase [Protaetiibacter sp. WY-16]MDO7882667.1 5-dehydro-4-deoxy-D-glucuronate isomerase [Protaetiibacter sp. WY-16]
MQIRHATHPDDLALLDSAELKDRFLLGDLFVPGEASLVYSHHDRMILGGAVPLEGAPITLEAPDDLRAEYFLERRELAAVAVGAGGAITVDGTRFELANKDVLYVGRGAREVVFEATGPDSAFFLASATSHTSFPTTLVPLAEALTSETGDKATANERTVYKHLHDEGVRTSQLVLGITALKPGSVWNSMPPHTHDRRTEVYLYMDLPEEHRVQHFMGEPSDLRPLAMKNRDGVISPSWSVHFGAGSTNYSFVWVMAGENQSFADMDQLAVTQLG